jgi:hypothetical protein
MFRDRLVRRPPPTAASAITTSASASAAAVIFKLVVGIGMLLGAVLRSRVARPLHVGVHVLRLLLVGSRWLLLFVIIHGREPLLIVLLPLIVKRYSPHAASQAPEAK